MDIEHKKAVISESQKGESPSPADSHDSAAKRCVYYTMYSCNETCETSLLKVQVQ